jgi:rhodanese-related sulfurtransferase
MKLMTTRRLLLVALSAIMGVTAQDVKKLTQEEIEEALEKKNIFFLDVRDPKEIASLGTLEGYVNIPLPDLESRLKEIPKDKLIITA